MAKTIKNRDNEQLDGNTDWKTSIRQCESRQLFKNQLHVYL